MRRELEKLSRGPYCVFLLLLCLGAFARQGRAQVDASINQTVWKMYYGVTDAQVNDPAWLARDDDGDGLSNGAELAAGTNPFDPSSKIAISTIWQDANGVNVMTPTVPGKQYVLQATADITKPASWAALTPAVQAMGTGSPVKLTAPAGPANMFYRVAVQDVDSDGDGVSDWAEGVAGLDPATGHTHGDSLDDHTALSNDLTQENVVTVAATKSTATEPPDASTPATDTATITVTRGGTLHFSAITVPLSRSGSAIPGVDYASLPTSVTFPVKVSSIPLTVIPMANPSRKTGSTVTLGAVAGGGYALGSAHTASATISPAANATGSGLTGIYYNGTSSTVSPYNPNALFAGSGALTRVDPTVDFTWTGSPGTGVNATYFGVRWQGQVQPQYSETYYFDILADDGCKLWVNGQLVIDTWAYSSADRIGSIALQAGVLYDIKLEYYQATGGAQAHLSWYSNSQTKQVIPANRLYPLSSTPAPPAITSAPLAIGFVNQPFTFNVTASVSGGNPTYGLASGAGSLPPGLSLNATSGLISGTATVAGDYQVALQAGNVYGTGAAALEIQILNAGSGVTRELWPNLSGSNVADMPPALATPPSPPDNQLATLEDNAQRGNNTGERLRGYFVAPATGNYYFWLAASNNAELWISDNAEPVGLIRRAWITAPGTTAENWNTSGQLHQRSPWLALVAGQRYYYEVVHNTGGSGSASNLAVGYAQDPTGAAGAPSGVVPAYVLTAYDYPTTTAAAGTLYGTNLSPQGVAASAATGSANLRLLPGNTQAILHFNYSGLSSPRTAYHIHIAPDNTGSGPIVFDLDDVDKFHPELKTADGGYIWNIVASGAYSAAQIVTAVQQGTTYFNVHTVNYPGGEIRGFLTLVDGAQNAPAPVPNPGFADDSNTDAGAARFLNQAAFGAAPADLAAVKSGGYAAWLQNQMALPPTHLLPDVKQQAALIDINSFISSTVLNAWWRESILSPDQLRQRVAFALSELMVVSDQNQALAGASNGLASYYDTLLDNAFGNFRDLLKAVTLHPTMGWWLNMQGNVKGNLATGYHPNENYAREIIQLFSVGLNRLWPDGSLVLDSQGNVIPTYNQGVITNGFARVFTGWTWNQALQSNGQLPTNFRASTNYTDPMVMVKTYHELGPKTLLDNVVLPAAAGYSLTASPVAGSQADSTTAAYDSYCLGDLDKAIDSIFYHPNVGPFVCRQLIQRLVASNPSPAYLYRVVQKFNDDGSPGHVRGNMAAVVTAILLDGEARNPQLSATTGGKQREPLMRIAAPSRTFLSSSNSGTFSQTGGLAMTVTTSKPHHFNAGDTIALDFSGNATGSPAAEPSTDPTYGSYTVLSNPAPTSNTFAVNASGLMSGACAEPAGSTTLTVSFSGPAVGEKVYLKFLGGHFQDGIYTIAGTPDSSHITVTTSTAASAATSDTAVSQKTLAYVNVVAVAGTKVNGLRLSTFLNTNLAVNDHVWLHTGSAFEMGNAEWVISTVTDNLHSSLAFSGTITNTTSPQSTLYPLIPPVLVRSGTVGLPASKFDMGNTNSALTQSPLDSPTVFNFFYPDFQYPGSLSANDVTTPEFQLTTDSNIVNLSNTILSTILASGNTSGLSNFKNGAINLDLSPYMIAPYASVTNTTGTSGTKVTITSTTTVDAAALVNKLGDLLTGGQLTQQSKNLIIAFINNTTNFPTTTTVTGTTSAPPVAPGLPTTSSRDKARAVVQAILTSSEYAIQR